MKFDSMGSEGRGGIVRGFNLLESTSFTERMPRRLGIRLHETEEKPPNYREEWGLNQDCRREFSSTVDQVVEEAFSAVAGTIYESQKLDPNVVRNAVSKSIFTQRPVKKARDSGRIGLEIDGAEHLFPEASHKSAASAIRRIALLLAAKLSHPESWQPFEKEFDTIGSSKYRPVVVCFNTIKQALIASHDLKRLQMDHSKWTGRQGGDDYSFDNIKIQCIHDGVPRELQQDQSSRRRRNGLMNGYVNETKGHLLVVQPTDYNSELKPPGPAIDAVGSFQKLVAQASLEEVPVIALSPRFLSNETPYCGWDQSGYQKSATFGGLEPPKGPTPWIMRDFTPPAYCWIGDALRLPVPRMHPDFSDEQCYLSRIALMQSTMEHGHSWHIFVAKECMRRDKKLPTEYISLGSTSSNSGRPTRAVLRQILEDHKLD